MGEGSPAAATYTDTLGFVEAVRGLPEQLGAAHRAAAGLDPALLPDAAAIDHVVVCGMGGSGISGDVLQAVAGPHVDRPIVVVKHPQPPGFVGPRSLVFLMSYSGGTDETLAAADEALARGAHVVAVSSGGPLAELVGSRGGIVVPCPPGYMPRAALGTLVVPLFVVLFRMGLLAGAHQWLVDAEAQLGRRRDACAPEVPRPRNPAKELARRIGRTMPLVYGGGPIGGVAALRWKADVNENAKAPAFWNVYPELDHNEICGWGQHGDVTRQVITLVELRHDYEDPQTADRFRITREIVEEAVAAVLEARAEGSGPLAQLLDLMYLGDWVSVYLALDNEVDPGPIDAIARLKSALAAG